MVVQVFIYFKYADTHLKQLWVACNNNKTITIKQLWSIKTIKWENDKTLCLNHPVGMAGSKLHLPSYHTFCGKKATYFFSSILSQPLCEVSDLNGLPKGFVCMWGVPVELPRRESFTTEGQPWKRLASNKISRSGNPCPVWLSFEWKVYAKMFKIC